MKLDRRLLLRGAVAGGGLAALQGLMPAWAITFVQVAISA